MPLDPEPPRDLADLMRHPEKLAAAWALLRSMEKLQIVVIDTTVNPPTRKSGTVRWGPDGGVVELKV